MSDMRTIRLTRKSPLLHIEAPGCIINIQTGLSDRDGNEAVNVSISADGKRYAGNPQWWIDGEAERAHLGVRVVKTDTPTPGPDAEPLAGLLDALRSYVTAEDADMERGAFLRMVADRITDDLATPLIRSGDSVDAWDALAAGNEAPVNDDLPPPISNDDKTIDSAAIDARITYLREWRFNRDPAFAMAPDDTERSQDDMLAELAGLEAVQHEGKQIAGDWGGTAVLIRDDHWDDWAAETARDVGIPVGDVTKIDYVSLEFNGATHWLRG